MDQLDIAIHATVHDAELSTNDISARLGMSRQILLNKANPQSDTHKLTVREAVALQIVTCDDRINRAMQLAVPSDPGPQVPLLTSVLTVCREQGDVVRVIDEALKDGKLSLREAEMCQKEIDDLMHALADLRSQLKLAADV